MDGRVTLLNPIEFKQHQKQAIRLIKVSFSSQIPNVYSLGSFNNGLLRVSKDAGVNWTAIQLPNGVYTAGYIEGAINTTIAAWWTNSADPGFAVRFNLATQIFYIELDSTKLAAPGQLGIDLSFSDIGELMGYNDPLNKIFVVDGLHTADSYAKMDWAGNNVSVLLDGFGPISIRNGALSNELCSVPLSSAKEANEYLYPLSGISTPFMPLNRTLGSLSYFAVSFKGSRVDSTGQQMPIYITEGNVELQFELRWTN
jgi:hypothetical protein